MLITAKYLISEKKKTFKFKCFSIYRLNAKEKWVIFSKVKKCLIGIFDCYNLKPNTETLPDLRWSSFRRQLTVGSQYLSPQLVSTEMWQGS